VKIIYLEPAKRDLERLQDFLVSSGVSEKRSGEIIGGIIIGIRILKNTPHVGFSFGGKYGFSAPYRGLVVGNYIVVYEAEEQTVEIRRIYSGREDYLNELMG
jgi:plasmid stabilization system protein ParE